MKNTHLGAEVIGLSQRWSFGPLRNVPLRLGGFFVVCITWFTVARVFFHLRHDFSKGFTTQALYHVSEIVLRWLIIVVSVFTILAFVHVLANRRYIKLTCGGVVRIYGAVLIWFFAAQFLGAWAILWYSGVLSYLLGWVVGNEANAVVDWGVEPVQFLLGVPAAIVGFGLLSVGAEVFASARRRLGRGADDYLRIGSRPAILYLRPFNIDSHSAPDASSLQERRNKVTWRALSPAFWLEAREWTFEETICIGLNTVAPVVAIGQPGERLPKLGAARKYVADGLWQSEVRRLASMSRFVCLVMGHTPGLIWEIGEVMALVGPKRVLLVLPESEVSQSQWQEFVRTCAQSIEFPAKVPYFLPEQPLALAFRDDWQSVIFTGRATANSYRQIGRWMIAAIGDERPA